MKNQTSEEKYRNIIENIHLGLLEVDLDERIKFANNSFCDMTGYSLEELKGRVASELFIVDEESRDVIYRENESRKDGQSSAYEVKIKRKDGRTVWMIISGAPIRNKKGEVVGSIGIHNDISKLKKQDFLGKRLVAELENRNKQLNQKQQYLKALNHFTTELISAKGLNEIAQAVTEKTMELFGFTDCVLYLFTENKETLYQVSAFGPKNQDGIVNPIEIRKGEGIVGTVAATGVAEIVNNTSLDDRYIVDDAIRLSELAVPMIVDDEIIGVIDSEHPDKNFYTQEHLETLLTIARLTSTKINNAIISGKRKETEIALAESEGKMKSIVDSALDAVITIDDRGKVTEWNPQASELFEFTREEAIGKRLSDLIIPQKYRDAHNNGMRRFNKTNEARVLNQRIEITGLKKSGDEFPIELSIVQVKMKGKHFFSAFVRDITLRKKAEEDMKQALEKQKELNELKSRFVSLTSHEFRTPLTTIQTNVELLSFQLGQQKLDNREKLDKNFGRISNEIIRLTSMMNDILMLGRIDSGRVPFNPTQGLLSDLIREVIKQSFSNEVDGRTIDLTVTGEEKTFDLDPAIYTHILTNLMSNALKYSPGKSNPKILVEFGYTNVKIILQDFGMGIPKEDQSKLFEIFHRASNVDDIQGSGLGLSIVKQFVEIHGGEINFESDLGIGSTFIVNQPLNKIEEIIE